MSRIGKKPIAIPKGVKVVLTNGVLAVEGPKGKLQGKIPPSITLEMKGDIINVTRADDSSTSRSLHGLTRTLVSNMVVGTSSLFTKTLEINGLGFKGVVKGRVIELALGYSHPVVYNIPEGITLKTVADKIIVEGADKCLVGEVAAQIRKLRLPEPYKGTGIKYDYEVIKRKVGKAAGTASAS